MCKLDTDGDGNCPIHPYGCPDAGLVAVREAVQKLPWYYHHRPDCPWGGTCICGVVEANRALRHTRLVAGCER
jgi:hypothetical protein